jgi:hypothetical protein
LNAEGVKLVEDELSWKVYNRIMDSAGKGMNATEERSFFDAYREAGLFFRAAKKNRDLNLEKHGRSGVRPTLAQQGRSAHDPAVCLSVVHLPRPQPAIWSCIGNALQYPSLA